MSKKITARLTEQFDKALVCAHQLHRQQIRKATGVPYIAHLLSVSALVLEDGGSEEEAIAALLHDAIEDQGGAATRDKLLSLFGDRVVAIVEGCTESPRSLDLPWRERKQRYLEQLRQSSPAVRRVALADKLHNARSLLYDYRQQGEALWDAFPSGKEGVFWFYDSLIELYRQTDSGPMLGELECAIAQLKTISS